jgi:hypothetical protein
MKTQWSVTDLTGAEYLGIIEFQDLKGEWHNFEVMATETRVVFGGACNVGFLESGYIERDGFKDDETGEFRATESVDETLQEMLSDLEVYYNDGPQYVSRIVCNQRM